MLEAGISTHTYGYKIHCCYLSYNKLKTVQCSGDNCDIYVFLMIVIQAVIR